MLAEMPRRVTTPCACAGSDEQAHVYFYACAGRHGAARPENVRATRRAPHHARPVSARWRRPSQPARSRERCGSHFATVLYSRAGREEMCVFG
jgi:hypothetical protein